MENEQKPVTNTWLFSEEKTPSAPEDQEAKLQVRPSDTLQRRKRHEHTIQRKKKDRCESPS